jgi:spermidine synthase
LLLLAPFVLTLLVSSCLIFLVQPMVAKMVLPLLGGVPAVWTTSILFFQAVLLAGYAYAHLSVNRLGPRRQAVVQVVLVLVPLLALPVAIHSHSPPTDSNPIPWLLGALVLACGLPMFVASSTGPVIQRWFASTRRRGARDPYFLFAASNFGSLLGLLLYPLVLERTLSLDDQADLWSVGYVALIGLTVATAVVLWRSPPADAQPVDHTERPDRSRRIRWLVLAFVPSSLMLGVTAEITSEIAPIPLFWVVGLALYLVTLIVAFSLRSPLPPRLLVQVLPAFVVAVIVFTFLHPTHSPWVLLLHLVTFTLAAYVCHAQLAADRPPPDHLTEYYLWLSIGGALGGVFNGVIAPVVFSRLVEYPFALVLACFLRPKLLRPGRFWSRGSGLVALGFASFVLAAVATTAGQSNVLLADRSFFGLYTVKLEEEPEGNYHALVDGNTLHGMQSLNPARASEPLLYFYRGAPIGQVFRAVHATHPAARIGVIGLGAGSLSCYARPADRWTFFELDPDISKIAHDRKLFTLLPRCDPTAKIVLGDGRLSIATQPPHSFDLIALDAFNSESVPVHLLTREALATYTRELAPAGVLVFNVTNHFVDLHTVLANLAADAGLVAFERDDTEAGRKNGRAPSRWVAIARRASDLGAVPHEPGWRRLQPDPSKRVWTDQFSNVVDVLRFL